MCELKSHQINLSTLVLTGGDQTPSLVTEISGLGQNEVKQVVILSNSIKGKPSFKTDRYNASAVVKCMTLPELLQTVHIILVVHVVWNVLQGLVTFKELPPLNRPRYSHACGTYFLANIQVCTKGKGLTKEKQ